MAIPSGYVQWCEAHGLNYERPEWWPEAARAAFVEWKLTKFRVKWRWMAAIRQVELMAAQNGWPFVLREIRREYQDAQAPAPLSNPYRTERCPQLGMPPMVPVAEAVPMEAALAYVDAHPEAERMQVRSVKALCFLESFARRPGSVTAARGGPEPETAMSVPGRGEPSPSWLADAVTAP